MKSRYRAIWCNICERLRGSGNAGYLYVTVEPVNNDHLYNAIGCLFFI